jgi:diacylglycerol kinase (ATP)
MGKRRKIHVLINPEAGLVPSLNPLIHALYRYWETPGNDLTIQFSSSKEDGREKTRNAVDSGAEILLAAGGDGMINSIGAELIGTETALGVIPSGSGNGFARHFGIPLDIRRSAAALTGASTVEIDVGYANGLPFFVTCSLAWDAALVRTFEKSPMRGILPYLFAAVYEFFEYEPQPFEVKLDGEAPFTIENPMLFTAANLTQYGGGARIAPTAKADDGLLQLVTLTQKDLPWVLPLLGRVFDGTFDQIRRIETKSFRALTVRRSNPGPMQLDGELIETEADVEIRVRHRALKVLVP